MDAWTPSFETLNDLLKVKGGARVDRFKTDKSPLTRIRDLLNLSNHIGKLWNRFCRVVIQLDWYIPVPIFTTSIGFVMNVLNADYGSVSIWLRESLPQKYIDEDGNLAIELENELDLLIASLTQALSENSDFPDLCGDEVAYSYLFAKNPKGNIPIEQMEQHVRDLLGKTVSMTKSEYLRFLACLRVLLIWLFNENMGSFDIFLKMLMDAIRRGRISKRLGRFILNRLRKNGYIIPKQPIEY